MKLVPLIEGAPNFRQVNLSSHLHTWPVPDVAWTFWPGHEFDARGLSRGKDGSELNGLFWLAFVILLPDNFFCFAEITLA